MLWKSLEQSKRQVREIETSNSICVLLIKGRRGKRRWHSFTGLELSVGFANSRPKQGIGKAYLSISKKYNTEMVANFMCQHGKLSVFVDIWPNTLLDVSMKVYFVCD